MIFFFYLQPYFCSKTLCSRAGTRGGGENLHSVAGDYLVSILVPGHQRSGEGGQRGRADDGRSALRHRLPLLPGREVPQDCRRRRRKEKTVSNYTEPAGTLMKVIKYLQPGKKKGRLRPGRFFRWCGWGMRRRRELGDMVNHLNAINQRWCRRFRYERGFAKVFKRREEINHSRKSRTFGEEFSDTTVFSLDTHRPPAPPSSSGWPLPSGSSPHTGRRRRRSSSETGWTPWTRTGARRAGGLVRGFFFLTAALPKRIYVTTFFSRTAAARTSKSLLISTGRQLTMTMTSKHQFEEPPTAIGMQHCAYEILMLVSSFKDLWDWL